MIFSSFQCFWFLTQHTTEWIGLVSTFETDKGRKFQILKKYFQKNERKLYKQSTISHGFCTLLIIVHDVIFIIEFKTQSQKVELLSRKIFSLVKQENYTNKVQFLMDSVHCASSPTSSSLQLSIRHSHTKWNCSLVL